MNPETAPMPSRPRVFWPGDEIPPDTWVMSPSGEPFKPLFDGTRVGGDGPPVPLVEVPRPDYQWAVWAARVENERPDLDLGWHPGSGRWGAWPNSGPDAVEVLTQDPGRAPAEELAREVGPGGGGRDVAL